MLNSAQRRLCANVIIQGNLNAAIQVSNRRHFQQTPAYDNSQSNQVPLCIPSPGFPPDRLFRFGPPGSGDRLTTGQTYLRLHGALPASRARRIEAFPPSLARRPVMALVGSGSLQRDNPHHESINSILLGPHGPRSQQAIASSQVFLFEVGDGLETRRENDSQVGDGVGDISIEGRSSEDKLIQTAKYPNSSQRTPLAPNLRERQSKSLFVSILSFLFALACYCRFLPRPRLFLQSSVFISMSFIHPTPPNDNKNLFLLCFAPLKTSTPSLL